MFLMTQQIHAQVSGVVYKDYNAAVSQQVVAQSNEAAATEFIVNAYSTSNVLVATTIQVCIEYLFPTRLIYKTRNLINYTRVLTAC